MNQMASSSFNWHLLAVVMVCLLTPTASSQVQGCSVQGLDIGQCFKPSNGQIANKESCCKVLNEAVRAGYNCLCLLLGSSYPDLLSPSSLSSPLSHCSISVPLFTHCHVVAPLPANSSSEAHDPSFPPKHKGLFWPRSPPYHLRNSTGDRLINAVEIPPPSADEAGLTKICTHQFVLIFIVFHAYLLLL
ncbi:hypothetical protein LINPERPRIM_LOCUS17273, partial [Linum perenne]